MKILRILVLILVTFSLVGCSGSKSEAPTTANSDTSPAESEASASQTPISAPQQLTAVSFKWIGVDQDVLSPNEVKVDTKPDGHFHITVPFGTQAGVKSIWIRYSEFGKSLKWGWIYNKNLSINGYLLAVLDNSGKVILPQADNGFTVEGVADFDLYLSELESESGRDTFKFMKGQRFELEINYVTQNNVEQQVKSSVTIE
ncbi:hypothetical protein DP73_03630 [Desulfosporosinus sp. HMP52]|uniref:hypothetical protein n=1 Tax=Desulfosporosinus sp. HMP52 TaxID=1487923 RepID=UPI00051FD5D6|nr:hypothetical protein [Desulfosporosinus sp. HMP52]KGK91369.1 hypothetical protein DP73_03630 [Desulfosporosinus sp. HMP52]